MIGGTMNTDDMRVPKWIAAVALVVASASAQPESYPTKPIRLIVPFPSGGATDIVARAVQEKIHVHLGQRFIVDNRVAQAGVLGTSLLANAAADGYTLGMATVSTIATAPAMGEVPYRPLHDFAPIINVAATPNVLVVNPKRFPASDFKGFLTEVGRRPGHYTAANAGIGSLGHALIELFQSATRTSIRDIPYKGGNPAMTAVVGGEVDLMIANSPTVLPHVVADPKRLVAIAVAAEERLPAIRDVPTFKELRLPEVNRVAFYGIAGPRGLNRSIIDTLNAAVMKTIADPQVRMMIENTGSVVIGNSPEAFSSQIRTEHEIYQRVLAKQKSKQ